MPQYTQSGRDMAITTPLGDDMLLLRSMRGVERMGSLGEFELELLSESDTIAIDDILGLAVTVTLGRESESPRHFNGYVTRFALTGAAGRFFTYRATMRPWLWFLTRTTNCRVFQHMTVPDIVKKIFQDHALPDYRTSLSATYEPRDYCVQYDETDFDFVGRLLEEEGIYYFFTHTDTRHTLVLADSYSAHDPVPGTSTLQYRPGHDYRRDEAIVTSWQMAREMTSGAAALTDYNFETPHTSLLVVNTHPQPPNHGNLEVFAYPGNHMTTSLGGTRVRTRLESMQARYEHAEADTLSTTVHPGGLITLADHPRADQNREYLVIETHYSLSAGDYGHGGGETESYKSSFAAVPSSVAWRSPRVTPKPVMRGPQTAKVVGKSGEDLWVDQYGRVKVQFHWDRVGQSDENSSCWVRVAQSIAGKQWGALFLPRIGQEVVVSFLDGDPDRPLVTGGVYNADCMPPYTLPDDQTKSTLKTRSSKEGTAENFNEIRFEDKKDAEEVYVHAEKDMNRVVENNDTLKVGFEKKDKGDQTVEIFNNQTLKIGTSEAETGDQTVEIFRNQMLTIGNNQTVKVGKSGADAGDQTVEIFHDQTLKVGNDRTVTIENDETSTIKNNQTVDVKNDQSVTVGNTCVIEAQTSIELKVGGSSIKIESGKITIKTTQLAIEGSGQVEVKSGGTMDIKASGPLTVKGAIVQIN